jgi:hemerythrin
MDEFVEWQEKYALGIPKIDDQHKQLFALTNELYTACHAGGEKLTDAFMDAAHKAVDYVRLHFSDEEKMLERVHYPALAEHRTQHETFVKHVLESTKAFGTMPPLAAFEFVRFLRDWILSHILVNDKAYGKYISDLKAKGKLGEVLKVDDAV